MNCLIISKSDELSGLSDISIIKKIYEVRSVIISEIYRISYSDFQREHINEDDILVFSSYLRRKDIIYAVGELYKNKSFVLDIAYVNGGVIDNPIIPVEDFYYLDTLLVPVCDHCNLNCKRCSHFSPLVEGDVFYDVDVFYSDINRLRKLINHSDRINFLGGEPLLNKNLDKFLYIARNEFKYANLKIVTNGILILDMSWQLRVAIKETNTELIISSYPIFKDHTEKCISFLKCADIKYVLYPGDRFAPILREHRGRYPYDNNELCDQNVTLHNGHIMRCPMYDTIKYYNKKFGTNFSVDDGFIDIYDSELSPQKLHKRLNKPVELCDYCARWEMPNLGMKPWEIFLGEEPLCSDWL
ncbi:4Fe-4S cluster-binding domain-containing protein [Butyrivibrio sp. FC2001]|uniref:4Fe-4S cluster-binding domain-containing protein n=1 Tax=Butyrivibrio sp. FC2001 TaxID=1280671 RepID=UPI00040FDD27|nr:4Fe-4S cluster-binding domain-containing protein [Butyrivibrio sp. FC2001]